MKAKDNPFATDRVLQVRYRLSATEWAGLLARLQSLGYRAALVGPEGSGKTTLLEDLAPRLVALGFTIQPLRLYYGQRRFPADFPANFLAKLTPRDCILLDSAEQLSRWSWHAFKRDSRRAGGLIITTHRPGLLPDLRRCSTTPELLYSLVEELVGSEEAELLRETIFALYAKYQGNLRDAMRELYDLYAGK